MEDLRQLGPGTVAVYTLITDRAYRVILITPDVEVAREYPIGKGELNAKVAAFREAVQNPKLDPMPGAKELYKILIGPIARDLEGSRAQTLMLSLDGVLRYVPIAALHDGHGYLLERYRLALFTPASHSRMKEALESRPKALGLGVLEGSSALSGTARRPAELRSIIRVGDAKSSNAVLSGRILLDERFTKSAMKMALAEHSPSSTSRVIFSSFPEMKAAPFS